MPYDAPTAAPRLAPMPPGEAIDHEALGEAHAALVRLLRHALRRTAAGLPEAREAAQAAVVQGAAHLAWAHRHADRLEDRLTAPQRRALRRPLHDLFAAHGDADGEFLRLRAALPRPDAVGPLRLALEGMLAAVGRAEQAHYHLRRRRLAAAA
jgi:hypothetical protein